MKKVLNTLFLTFSLSSVFAQITTLPTGIGVGVTNPSLPLHINKPGEVVRLEGTAPFLTLWNASIWRGYLQATAAGNFEIGTKNSSDMTFFTGDLQRMSISGTTGRVSFSDGIRVTGSLQALGGSSGTMGQVLVSNGAGTPFWGDNFENPQVGFLANYLTNFGPFTGSTPLTGFNEVYDNAPITGSFNPTTGIFTAPSSGVYHFTVNFAYSWVHTSTDRIYIDFYKNGTRVKTMLKIYSDNPIKADFDSYGFDINLVANDQVNIYLVPNFSISLLNSASANANFEFSGFKVY